MCRELALLAVRCERRRQACTFIAAIPRDRLHVCCHVRLASLRHVDVLKSAKSTRIASCAPSRRSGWRRRSDSLGLRGRSKTLESSIGRPQDGRREVAPPSRRWSRGWPSLRRPVGRHPARGGPVSTLNASAGFFERPSDVVWLPRSWTLTRLKRRSGSALDAGSIRLVQPQG